MPWEAIKQAIANSGNPSADCLLSLHFQPIVRLEELSSPPTYFEALVRLNICGVELSPRFFMPGLVAEHPSTLIELDWWVLGAVAKQIRRDQSNRRYSVNVSGVTLNNPAFHTRLASLYHGLEASKRLVIEITESQRLTELAVQVCEQVSDFCPVLVDDMGEAHSSIALVIAVNPSGFKLGRALMQGVVNCPRRQFWVSLLCRGAALRGYWVVAEFVEDQATVDWLQTIKAELPTLQLWLQGYAIGR